VDAPALVHDQTAVGLLAKSQLADAEDDNGIDAAADDGERQRDQDGRAEFSK